MVGGNRKEKRRGEKRQAVRGNVYQNMEHPAQELPPWTLIICPRSQKDDGENDGTVTVLIQIRREIKAGRQIVMGELREGRIAREDGNKKCHGGNAKGEKVWENAPKSRPAERHLFLLFFYERSISFPRQSIRPKRMCEDVHALIMAVVYK